MSSTGFETIHRDFSSEAPLRKILQFQLEFLEKGLEFHGKICF